MRNAFLADRTNGRAYATVLRPSVAVCRLSVRNVLWLNGASYSKSYY